MHKVWSLIPSSRKHDLIIIEVTACPRKRFGFWSQSWLGLAFPLTWPHSPIDSWSRTCLEVDLGGFDYSASSQWLFYFISSLQVHRTNIYNSMCSYWHSESDSFLLRWIVGASDDGNHAGVTASSSRHERLHPDLWETPPIRQTRIRAHSVAGWRATFQ